KMKRTLFAVIISITVLSLSASFADEGMWLFENAPVNQVKTKYNFNLTDEWLDHVRLSSIRFGRGGSASFVSPRGLIMTNHHVGAAQLQMHSTPENDMLKNGFYAKTLADELPCKGLECIVLDSVKDITAELEKVTSMLPSDVGDVTKLRNETISKIEQEEANKSNLHCEVVTFFQGGKYHLYRYKKYTDIRLVWAPEQDIAAFGGDPDNYEYPRFCVDCSFFRAYENNKPAEIKHYLKWSTDGVKENDLVFVSGHPGTTNRAFTHSHLEFQRDVFFPERLSRLYRREVIYSAFAERSLENKRRIAHDLDAVKNYRKRAIGQLEGLQTPSLWKSKPILEQDPMSEACKGLSYFYKEYCYFELGEAFNSQTFRLARQLVRLAQEKEKPNAERLREYRDGNIDSIKRSILNDSPIYEDVEILKLSDSLSMLYEFTHKELIPSSYGVAGGYGGGYGGIVHNPKKALLQRTFEEEQPSPKELAVKLISGSKLRDVAVRQKLLDGGIEAINESDDPMIKFAIKVDSDSRKFRKDYETHFDAPMTKIYTDIAKKRLKEFGNKIYPDATFTLRLSYGIVKGYEESGKYIQPVTNIAGMFKRAESMKFKEPFNPPKSWLENKTKLDPNTGFNLVTTNDIIGGNSGSPLINAKGEVIGLVFDGNIYSLSNNFIYTETQSRCVSVHVDVILESLKKIYNAERLVKEITEK
ncbi:MAG: S46 family peptidase, partial [Planctomycetaceae bacterium]|nr:S46 family peptidase [Planctomycetaceae bacterium]